MECPIAARDDGVLSPKPFRLPNGYDPAIYASIRFLQDRTCLLLLWDSLSLYLYVTKNRDGPQTGERFILSAKVRIIPLTCLLGQAFLLSAYPIRFHILVTGDGRSTDKAIIYPAGKNLFPNRPLKRRREREQRMQPDRIIPQPFFEYYARFSYFCRLFQEKHP